MRTQSGLTSDQVLICFEYTGLYSFPLAEFLSKRQIKFSMVAALEIKRSLGIVRGKNDKIDARRIAEYAYLRKDNLKPFELPSGNIRTAAILRKSKPHPKDLQPFGKVK
jgi:transposase